MIEMGGDVRRPPVAARTVDCRAAGVSAVQRLSRRLIDGSHTSDVDKASSLAFAA